MEGDSIESGTGMVDDSMGDASIVNESAVVGESMHENSFIGVKKKKTPVINLTDESESDDSTIGSSKYFPVEGQKVKNSVSRRESNINTNDSEMMEQSSFFGVRTKKKIGIINSDASETESSDEEENIVEISSENQNRRFNASEIIKPRLSSNVNNKKESPVRDLSESEIMEGTTAEEEQNDMKTNRNSTRRESNDIKSHEMMDQSSFHGVRTKKKIPTINSDESESESSDEESNVVTISSEDQSRRSKKSDSTKRKSSSGFSKKKDSPTVDLSKSEESQHTTLEEEAHDREKNSNSVQRENNYTKNNEIMEQSSFFGVRTKKKIAVIDSDASESESSDGSDDESSENSVAVSGNDAILKNKNKTILSDEMESIAQKTTAIESVGVEFQSSKEPDVESSENSDPPSPEFLKGPMSRMSENFKTLKSSLCSTMIGNDLDVLSDSDSSEVIEVSDEGPSLVPVKVKTPKSVTKPHAPATMPPSTAKQPIPERERVSKTVYNEQKRVVAKLQQEFAQANNVFKAIDVSKLPDKGKLMRGRIASIKESLKTAQERLDRMVIDEALQDTKSNKPRWEDIKIESDIVQPKTLGRQALTTYNTQKSLTMDRLKQLHGSLANCPDENFLADDPKGLKISLMPHQKHALAWLMWREQQQPSGGILADDMGLGKTLTMISLMLKSIELAPDRDENQWKGRDKEFIHGGTLIVCPASLVKQWEAEISKHCKRGLVNVESYHGPKRETKATTLAKYDMVITTYTICQNEGEKSTPLFRINWRRVILDEGHQIRNHKSQTAIAACKLEARSRWILTGTPVHNKELDMYSLMKFLRCSPFDDYTIWKTWIANKDTGGYQRLQTVIASLMLRRTKAQLQEKGALQSLPKRTWNIVEVKLSEDETAIYEKVLMFSRSIFAQYLNQRSNKNGWTVNERPTVAKPIQPDNPYYKIYEKISKRCKEVKQYEILMVLLRLRQCCCHPSLITQMLERAELEEDEDEGVMNIMAELEKLDLDDNKKADRRKSTSVEVTKKFSAENPLFSSDYKSKKVEMIMQTVNEIVNKKKEKVIIVSQWTSFLKLIGKFLKEERIQFEQLDGTLRIDKRMEVVQNINNSSHPTRVLLLSLTAGGVGLNLVGANHLLLIDIHWNPQLESQAQDRIYRVGQKRPVYIYKFITSNTIEEQVKNIQDYKLSIADSMLTGSKVEHTKLSLQDLRLLFNM